MQTQGKRSKTGSSRVPCFCPRASLFPALVAPGFSLCDEELLFIPPSDLGFLDPALLLLPFHTWSALSAPHFQKQLSLAPCCPAHENSLLLTQLEHLTSHRPPLDQLGFLMPSLGQQALMCQAVSPGVPEPDLKEPIGVHLQYV